MASVKMPQLGESITEGTISKWLKKPGDQVKKYEGLVEIITDKVNAEVPAPLAGVLKEIKVQEGATVTVGTEIAVIEESVGAKPAPSLPSPEGGSGGAACVQRTRSGGTASSSLPPGVGEPGWCGGRRGPHPPLARGPRPDRRAPDQRRRAFQHFRLWHRRAHQQEGHRGLRRQAGAAGGRQRRTAPNGGSRSRHHRCADGRHDGPA